RPGRQLQRRRRAALQFHQHPLRPVGRSQQRQRQPPCILDPHRLPIPRDAPPGGHVVAGVVQVDTAGTGVGRVTLGGQHPPPLGRPPLTPRTVIPSAPHHIGGRQGG